MRIKMDALPMERFDPNAIIDCIGKPLRYEGRVVGTIIDYEIIDRRLIIECEIDDEEIIMGSEG